MVRKNLRIQSEGTARPFAVCRLLCENFPILCMLSCLGLAWQLFGFEKLCIFESAKVNRHHPDPLSRILKAPHVVLSVKLPSLDGRLWFTRHLMNCHFYDSLLSSPDMRPKRVFVPTTAWSDITPKARTDVYTLCGSGRPDHGQEQYHTEGYTQMCAIS